MKVHVLCPVFAVLFAAFAFTHQTNAQPLAAIETVTVRDAGNAADVTNKDAATGLAHGAVAYDFAIGKYEVTIEQYIIFLNSVASVPSASYIADLWNASTPDISRSGSGTSSDPYVYSVNGPSGFTPPGASSPGNRPVSYVNWFDAARFANWMHNGATNGASTETGAYTLNGATNGVDFTRNAGSKWWIPSADEWYKAAYYKRGGTNAGYWLYPTQSDTRPGNIIGGLSNQANCRVGDQGDLVSGIYSVTQSSNTSSSQNYLTDVGAFSNSPGPYGTYDQGGNVSEWTEEALSGGRVSRGGSWGNSEIFDALRSSSSRGLSGPLHENGYLGFRMATIAPPPATNVILAVEKTTSLASPWQLDREINVGQMTNTNEFYKLKIRTVVE